MSPSSHPALRAWPSVVDRYVIYEEIASGGMATVHLGSRVGETGSSRTVAIKRLHSQFAKDPEFVDMFLDEARLTARIRHPNVVSTLEVVSQDGDLLLIMDYAHGEPLSQVMRASVARGEQVPLREACGIVSQALQGLHAAHRASSEGGEPLNIIHRDVSPQNVMVRTDGVVQILDFGVAKAAMRASVTRDGQLKGKLAYMAPEQFGGIEVDRRVDVFAAGIVFWEVLTGRRLFAGNDYGETMGRIASGEIAPPSAFRSEIPEALDRVVLTALARDVEKRYSTALEFSIAIERVVAVASAPEVAVWMGTFAAEALEMRSTRVSLIESKSTLVPVVEVPSVRRGIARALSAAPRSGRLLTVLAAAAVGAAAVVVLLLAVTFGGRGESVTVSPPRIPTQVEAQSGVAPASALPRVVAPTAGHSAGTTPPSPPPRTSSTVSPTASKPRPGDSLNRNQRSRPHARSKYCRPPYRIDASGIRRIKPECL